MNITELKQLLEATPASHNIMLVGNHGIGKSEILTEHFKEFGMPVIALFLGQMADPGDLIGLPCKDEQTGKTDFMPPYWFPTDGKPIVLFLDELNRARPEILQTVMDLALNRKLAELWEEDELTAIQINEIIATTKSWGSIGGDLAEILQNSLKAKINWRNIFAGFRASVISSRRKLTRMKPNRRTGFQNMGSVIQFDCGITAVQSLKKVVKKTPIIGRGGTSFQEPIDYAHEHEYDGLVILTDGYAPEPSIPDGFRTGILWVCESEECHKMNKNWMEKSGR